MNDLKDPTSAEDALARSAEAERILAAFELGERVREIVVPRLEALVLELPRLSLWRGMHAGRRVLGARTRRDETASRETRPDYSRIEFEISTEGSTGRVALTRRTTLRNKDEAPTSIDVVLEDEGAIELTQWIETMLLRYADGYLGRTPTGAAG